MSGYNPRILRFDVVVAHIPDKSTRDATRVMQHRAAKRVTSTAGCGPLGTLICYVEGKLSDSAEFILGIALTIISIVAFIASLPRNGLTKRFVRIPFIAPTVSIVIIGGLAIGLIEIVTCFTTVDDMTLLGKFSPGKPL